MCDNSEPVEMVREMSETLARKCHECHECSRTIYRGELYHSLAFKGPNGFESHKRCHHCHIAAQWLVRECGHDLFGGCQDELREHWSHRKDPAARMSIASGLELGRLVVGMRRQWRRFDGKDLMQFPKVKGYSHE